MAVRALIFQATQRFAEAYREKFQLDRRDFLCLKLRINILEDLFPLFLINILPCDVRTTFLKLLRFLSRDTLPWSGITKRERAERWSYDKLVPLMIGHSSITTKLFRRSHIW
jgi:hypothetical protein